MAAKRNGERRGVGRSHVELTTHAMRELCVLAFCDPRTVVSYLEGAPQPSTTRARIEQALRTFGRPDLIGYCTRKAATRAANAEAEAKRR